MLTEAQVAAIMAMGDISGSEQELAQQLSRARGLRQTATEIRGQGRGYSIAKGAYGVASALSDYSAHTKNQDIAKQRAALTAALLRAQQPVAPVLPAPPGSMPPPNIPIPGMAGGMMPQE